ncbi:MAG TPA: toxin glutamine deamidase domain-containing protein, partial [Micromonospora sp.]
MEEPRGGARSSAERDTQPAVAALLGRPLAATSPSGPPPRPRVVGDWFGPDNDPMERRAYHGYARHARETYELNRRDRQVRALIDESYYAEERARQYATIGRQLQQAGDRARAKKFFDASAAWSRYVSELNEDIEATRAGRIAPQRIDIRSDEDFRRINDDVGRLAPGPVETGFVSALTGTDRPPSADTTRPYGQRGGLRPPLAQHQLDLERAMPRDAHGNVIRTADPRQGHWFRLTNDGGPAADPTRGINCLDCTLSFYETWVHGRPRVSAPRTFDGYLAGDINRPVDGEKGGPGRVEDVTGGRFLQFTPDTRGMDPATVQQVVYQGYRDLHYQLLAAGHGAFAFIINEWEGGGSHAWVAVNQNGTILYLDPQQGTIAENNPQYKHWGVPYPGNVVSLNALVLDANGRPLSLNRPQGKFSERPPLVATHDVPDINRLHLLLGPAATPAGTVSGPPGGSPDRDVPTQSTPGDPGRAPQDPAVRAEADGGPTTAAEADSSRQRESALRQARLTAPDALAKQGTDVATVIANASTVDAVFEAGVTPDQVAAHLDATTLKRLVPQLTDAEAQDIARLFADERVQTMLRKTWQEQPTLAETLVRQLVDHPDLVRLMHRNTVLFTCLTARPLTLHHVALHQKAIDVLDDVVTDIERRGAEAVAAEGVG